MKKWKCLRSLLRNHGRRRKKGAGLSLLPYYIEYMGSCVLAPTCLLHVNQTNKLNVTRTVTPTVSREEQTVPSNLRKEAPKDSKDATDDDSKRKKKKGSMFGGLFGCKKEKEKGAKESRSAGSASITSMESGYPTPDLEDSGRSTQRIFTYGRDHFPNQRSGPTPAASSY